MIFRYEGQPLRVRAGMLLLPLISVSTVACGHRTATPVTMIAVIAPTTTASVAPPPPAPPPADVAVHPAPPAASRGSARVLAPATTSTTTKPVAPPSPVVSGWSTAIASWYDVRAGAGACGRKCAPYAPYTFAHRTMAFGTAVQFCVDQRCVVAHCSDRGPYVDGRTFDLSRTVFAALGSTGAGTLIVRWSFV